MAKRVGNHDKTVPLVDRFWRSVEITDGCWEWIPVKDRPWRGGLNVNGKREFAARVSWMLHFGEIPDGLLVCHKCDNPKCVRPDHLFLGTQSENLQDSIAKGRFHTPARGSKGEKNAAAKLTAKQVAMIRKLYDGKRGSQVRLARQFGINHRQMSNIVNGKSWKHI